MKSAFQLVPLVLNLVSAAPALANSTGTTNDLPRAVWTCEERDGTIHPYVPALTLLQDQFGSHSALVRVEHEAWDTSRVQFLDVVKTVQLNTFIPRETYASRAADNDARYRFSATIDITSDTEASGLLTVMDGDKSSEVAIDCVKNGALQ